MKTCIYDGIICSKPHFKSLAPINEVEEVLIHIRFNIATVTKNVLNMANVAALRLI